MRRPFACGIPQPLLKPSPSKFKLSPSKWYKIQPMWPFRQWQRQKLWQKQKKIENHSPFCRPSKNKLFPKVEQNPANVNHYVLFWGHVKPWLKPWSSLWISNWKYIIQGVTTKQRIFSENEAVIKVLTLSRKLSEK